MYNLYKRFLGLVPDAPLQVGTVTSIVPGGAIVTLPSGGTLKVRGDAQLNQKVFIRDGVIEGAAPNLPIEIIEI